MCRTRTQDIEKEDKIYIEKEQKKIKEKGKQDTTHTNYYKTVQEQQKTFQEKIGKNKTRNIF